MLLYIYIYFFLPFYICHIAGFVGYKSSQTLSGCNAVVPPLGEELAPQSQICR